MNKLRAILTLSALSLLGGLAPLANAAKVGPLETVTEFTDYRAAGVAVTPAGRIVVSMHPLDAPKTRVVEVMANGSKSPFPTADWADGPETGEVGLSSVLGIHSDSKGVVWMLDMGSDSAPAQFVAWDSANNSLHKTIEIPKSVLLGNSFLQDFVIDETRQKIYIADMTFGNFNGEIKPAIIVVDIETGGSKRVLESTKAFMPPERDVVIDASLLASKAADGTVTKIRFGLNPITLDDKDKWLYFGALSGEKIYRMPASALANDTISNEKKASKIEVFGPKNPSDGIVYAPGGGVLVTDIENHAIGLTTKGNYKVLVQDKQLSWPDSFAVSNGYVYVTHDQLHQHPAFSQGFGNAKPPYKLMRFSYQP